MLNPSQRLRLGLRIFLWSAGIIATLATVNFFIAALTPGPDYQTLSQEHGVHTASRPDGTREVIALERVERGDAWSIWYGPLPAILWAITMMGMGLCFRSVRREPLVWAISFFAVMACHDAVVRVDWVGGSWVHMGGFLVAWTLGFFALYLQRLNGLNLSLGLSPLVKVGCSLEGAGCALPSLLGLVFIAFFPAEGLGPEFVICAPMVTLYVYSAALAVKLLGPTAVGGRRSRAPDRGLDPEESRSEPGHPS